MVDDQHVQEQAATAEHRGCMLQQTPCCSAIFPSWRPHLELRNMVSLNDPNIPNKSFHSPALLQEVSVRR